MAVSTGTHSQDMAHSSFGSSCISISVNSDKHRSERSRRIDTGKRRVVGQITGPGPGRDEATGSVGAGQRRVQCPEGEGLGIVGVERHASLERGRSCGIERQRAQEMVARLGAVARGESLVARRPATLDLGGRIRRADRVLLLSPRE